MTDFSPSLSLFPRLRRRFWSLPSRSILQCFHSRLAILQCICQNARIFHKSLNALTDIRIVIHHQDLTDSVILRDETRLIQILINLLSNAVKYTQEGGSIWLRIIGLEQRSGQYEHIRC